jgi:uncharacterized membrane protein YeaQ/YmgE (transglycosylase-associated protein family)
MRWKTRKDFLVTRGLVSCRCWIGAIAGWIAEKVTASNHSIFTNILVGVAGAFVAGVLASVLHIPVFGFLRTLVAAIIGAILILFVWHRVHSSA